MRSYDVQSIELAVPWEAAFRFVANAHELPRWTEAFAEVEGGWARMRTPAGKVEVGLRVVAEPSTRTIDWFMKFPDGSEAGAFSRIVPLGEDRCTYVFVLLAPPVPLEALEGALEAQSRTLAQELVSLKRVLEDAG